MTLVALGDRHDEAEVGVDHPLLRGKVAPLDALRELDLLARLEQRVPTSLAQEQLERVHRGVGSDLGLVLAARGIGDSGRFGVLPYQFQLM